MVSSRRPCADSRAMRTREHLARHFRDYDAAFLAA
jgi:hypothetical protein